MRSFPQLIIKFMHGKQGHKDSAHLMWGGYSPILPIPEGRFGKKNPRYDLAVLNLGPERRMTQNQRMDSMDLIDGSKSTLPNTCQEVNSIHRCKRSSRRIPAREWRCAFCSRLLGLVAGRMIQIKDRNRLQVTASLPAARQCPHCKRMNIRKEESAS